MKNIVEPLMELKPPRVETIEISMPIDMKLFTDILGVLAKHEKRTGKKAQIKTVNSKTVVTFSE